jgi:hypothetical protein
VAQALDGIIGQDSPLTHLLEKFADGFRVQSSSQQSNRQPF